MQETNTIIKYPKFGLGDWVYYVKLATSEVLEYDCEPCNQTGYFECRTAVPSLMAKTECWYCRGTKKRQETRSVWCAFPALPIRSLDWRIYKDKEGKLYHTGSYHLDPEPDSEKDFFKKENLFLQFDEVFSTFEEAQTEALKRNKVDYDDSKKEKNY